MIIKVKQPFVLIIEVSMSSFLKKKRKFLRNE